MFKMVFEVSSEEFVNTWKNKAAVVAVLRDVADEIQFDDAVCGLVYDKAGNRIGAYSLNRDDKK